MYAPGDKVYLDSVDIQMTQPSKKLSHYQLGPYPVKRCIGKYAYHLILPPLMRHLHPVFNVVKLTPAPEDPIPGRHQNPPPPPELIDSEVEYVVEKILNSRNVLMKTPVPGQMERLWGGTQHLENVNNALEKVVNFHIQNPAAPYCICAMAFGSIPFCPISLTSTLG